MNFAQYLNQLTNAPWVKNLDLSHLECSPGFVYVKDNQGKYLSCNQTLVSGLSLQKPEELLGLSDFELSFLPMDEAKKLKATDSYVSKRKEALQLIETVTLGNSTKVNLLSYKAPLISRSKKSFGLIGISFIKDYLTEQSQALTERQVDCLVLLVRGMTQKQMAKVLDISPRTIEHHLAAIRKKLDCRTRCDLFTKALQLKVIKDRL